MIDCEKCIHYPICEKASDEVERCVHHLEEPKQSEWISCSERLPDKGDFYLVTFKTGGNGRGVVMRFYRTKENLWTDDGVRRGFYLLPDEVTAWMPLPEPYEKEGETE